MALLKGLNPGRLSRRVTICRYSEGSSELGSMEVVLRPLKEVWAEIRPLRGNEQLEYYKITNRETYKITIRFTDITEKDVIVFKGRQFRINYMLNPLEANYYLELFVTEDKDHEVRREAQ
uniref:Head tail adaptor n=1 Tax=Siphoviridae sp. ctmP938 TaxID=2827933 RepID=A0A8S5S4Z1_9CAUD|nr:MAG TPA: Putative head tail adaptor [Siphoviridae sp. ctmP938]